MTIFKKAFKLLRVDDFIAFTIPVTLFGYGLGIFENHGTIDFVKLLFLIIANCSSVGFAFVINELEDYEDDGKKIDIQLARKLAFVTFLVAMVAYFLLGKNSFIAGILILVLAFLYSWKKVRLKAYPIVDILSHCLMLGGLLFLAGFYISGANLGSGLFLFLAINLASVYGQFYNQVRDFEEDKKAGLKNTTLLLGKALATFLMYATAISTLILVVYSFYIQILPLWFIPVGGLILFILIVIFKHTKVASRDEKSGMPIVNYHSSIRITLTILALIYILTL